MGNFITELVEKIGSFFGNFPTAGTVMTTFLRWVFVVLALYILVRSLISLIKAKNTSEIWAYAQDREGGAMAITHWENVIGRARNCDITLDNMSVSRNHATLIRNKDASWTVTDLWSKNGTAVNGKLLEPGSSAIAEIGDTIALGSSVLRLFPISLEEYKSNKNYRLAKGRPSASISAFICLTLFQLLCIVQLAISLGDDFTNKIAFSFLGLVVLMWTYYILLRIMKRIAFEVEIIAFFLSTLSLAVTASVSPGEIFTQFMAIVLGVILFFCMCWHLRDLDRTKRMRIVMIAVAIILLIANMIFGVEQYGAKNWLLIGPLSIQPSEIVKICFIYAGAASLNLLFEKKNLTMFMVFSLFCFACLGLMGDFGTAAIFFVTFLVISFLRSGDFSRLALIIGVAAAGIFLILQFKPYIAQRFAAWGHVWEPQYVQGDGFQQVMTMTSSASGGFLGLGAGNGALKYVFAADKDLVFGVLCEEWGLIIAGLAVLCIVTLCIFPVRSIMAGRSSFYTIAACSAMSMILFQTILNMFGSVDLLPLTGVTFPFVSNGGTSMLISWGLLAFLKAADTRQNASFAVRIARDDEINDMDDAAYYENASDIDAEVGADPGAGYYYSAGAPDQSADGSSAYSASANFDDGAPDRSTYYAAKGSESTASDRSTIYASGHSAPFDDPYHGNTGRGPSAQHGRNDDAYDPYDESASYASTGETYYEDGSGYSYQSNASGDIDEDVQEVRDFDDLLDLDGSSDTEEDSVGVMGRLFGRKKRRKKYEEYLDDMNDDLEYLNRKNEEYERRSRNKH